MRDVSSWIKSNATPEDMATLFQSQQEAQLRHLERLTTSNKTSKPGWIPVDDERAEVISGLQNHFFEKISEAKGLSKKEAWAQLKTHFEIFLHEKEIRKMHEVAFGMDTWPPEMMEETMLRNWPDRCQIQQAFQNWAGVGEFPNVSTTPTSEIADLKDKLAEVAASAKK